jgi:hypothetical protein
MPTAACYKHVQNTINCFSIIGTLSSNYGLRWNMRIDEIPLLVGQFGKSHYYPLQVVISKLGLNSFEISSLFVLTGDDNGRNFG